MRRPVLFLVVLLLVLRGWTGDALALQAPARAVVPPVAAPHCTGAVDAVHAAADAASRHAHRHGTAHGPAHPHPPGHGAGDAASVPPDPAAGGSPHAGAPSAPCGDAHAAHGGCGDCQVCHSAVPAFDARVAPAPTGPQAAPACGRAAFASADRAPDLRPPIVPPHRP